MSIICREGARWAIGACPAKLGRGGVAAARDDCGGRGLGPTLLRVGLYAALGVFAAYFLLPLAVMISTSLKSLDEIRTGSLISLPHRITFESTLRMCHNELTKGRYP